MKQLEGYWRHRLTNIAGVALSGVAVVVAVIPLVAMMAWVVGKGAGAIDLNFFTNLPVPTGQSGGGMINAIAGTILLIVIASVIGLPIGILSGIFLYQRGGTLFGTAVRYVTDVIAGTPSIIAGVIAYGLLVVTLGHFSALSGGVALALLMFPTVTRATEEALRLIPPAIHEAGLALGLPEWRTMVSIILPSALSGIITAIMLGIGRVAGETAPLLFTAFGNPAVQLSPSQPVEALPLQIWY
ncbi:MAG TPA: phosphate ABC transporter permease PstA, partial [Chloroflexota bacterium]|nr:phosphate ABC transporter permease PstA [Chloroflexota bacterium]